MRIIIIVISLIFISSSCQFKPTYDNVMSNTNNDSMNNQNKQSKVTIDFQAGFDGEGVIVSVDGKKVFNKTLKSNPLNAFTDSVSIEVNEGDVLLIEIPSKSIKEEIEVNTRKGIYLGVNFLNNQISIKQQPDQFFYQ